MWPIRKFPLCRRIEYIRLDHDPPQKKNSSHHIHKISYMDGYHLQTVKWRVLVCEMFVFSGTAIQSVIWQ